MEFTRAGGVNGSVGVLRLFVFRGPRLRFGTVGGLHVLLFLERPVSGGHFALPPVLSRPREDGGDPRGDRLPVERDHTPGTRRILQRLPEEEEASPPEPPEDPPRPRSALIASPMV
jgi:hypothetical protein